MIVKCNCDCKYCEEGICSKEEITISDTGEDYCLISYSSTSKSIFIHKIQGSKILLYHVTGELKQLDEKYIPDTIARTSSIDAITNNEIDEICGATIYAASEVEL